jgi:hypothetical protein
MPSRFWTARSSSPSFLAAQMKAQTTTASVNTLTAAIRIPRKVLTAAAYDPPRCDNTRLGQCSGMTPDRGLTLARET